MTSAAKKYPRAFGLPPAMPAPLHHAPHSTLGFALSVVGALLILGAFLICVHL